MALDFGPPLSQIFEALGQDATYLPDLGEARTITVLPSEPDVIIDRENSRLQSSSLTLEVLTSDVPSFKRGRDKIVFKGTTYVVKTAEIKDSLKLVWNVETYPVGCA